jgi:hypothetical protein
MWIVLVVLFVLIHMGIGMVPWVGMFAGNIVSPILMGGLAIGCRSLETGGDLELEHFLGGFRRNTGLLAAIGIVYAAGELLILVAFGLVAGTPFAWALASGSEQAILDALPEDPLRLALGGLVSLALFVPLLAAYWFAPLLAILHDIPAIPAMKESLAACLSNLVPMLVYGLVMLVLMFVALLPILLGLVVWVPLMFATVYASYRSVFTEGDGEEA